MADHRGSRRCDTCQFFRDRRKDWAGTPNLKWNDPDYRSPTYIDTSGHNLSGSAAGTCDWNPPPILRSLLWSQGRWTLVAASDWCHSWESQREFTDLVVDQQRLSSTLLLEAGP